tara:strand:- start:1903 stop:2121 length:219 start_codon:yes stop_codon:yes gene_type:complete
MDEQKTTTKNGERDFIAINHNGRIVWGPASLKECVSNAEEYTWATGNGSNVIPVKDAHIFMNESQMREAGLV